MRESHRLMHLCGGKNTQRGSVHAARGWRRRDREAFVDVLFSGHSQFILGAISELLATPVTRDTRDTTDTRDTRGTPAITFETRSCPAGRPIDVTALPNAVHEMETQTATSTIERASRPSAPPLDISQRHSAPARQRWRYIMVLLGCCNLDSHCVARKSA